MKAGDQVKIKTNRDNRREFNGYTGKINAVVYKDVAYVQVNGCTPTFFLNELKVLNAASKGGAA